jgi:hypothetical protein
MLGMTLLVLGELGLSVYELGAVGGVHLRGVELADRPLGVQQRVPGLGEDARTEGDHPYGDVLAFRGRAEVAELSAHCLAAAELHVQRRLVDVADVRPGAFVVQDALTSVRTRSALMERMPDSMVATNGTPRLTHPVPDAETGRGLLLVDHLAAAWAVRPRPDGRRLRTCPRGPTCGGPGGW